MAFPGKITALFLAVFLVGALAGAFTQSAFTDTKLKDFMMHTNDADSNAKRLELKYVKEYQLTPEEQARVNPLIREMTQHLYQLRSKFSTDILTTLNTDHKKIAEQMSPEHRAIYQQKIAAKEKQTASMLFPGPSQGNSTN